MSSTTDFVDRLLFWGEELPVRVLYGRAAIRVLQELDNTLRQRLKYEDTDSEEVRDVLEELRAALHLAWEEQTQHGLTEV